MLIRLFLILCTTSLFAEGLNFKADNYFIKKRYISRDTYTHYDDRESKDEHQDDIYAAARQFAEKNGCTTIGDIGCGSAFKLFKYFSDCKTVGFEISPTYEFLKEKFPERAWELSDFEKPPEHKTFDLLICSDVIEHLVDPDQLLNWILTFDFDYLVISTPDRDRMPAVWGHPEKQIQTLTGPPPNLAHVREWSFREFEKYLSHYFHIVNHFHPPREFYGQLIIATKKSLPSFKPDSR